MTEPSQRLTDPQNEGPRSPIRPTLTPCECKSTFFLPQSILEGELLSPAAPAHRFATPCSPLEFHQTKSSTETGQHNPTH